MPTPARHAIAIEHLRKKDKTLRQVIDRVGPCTLKRQRDRFRNLVTAIISQQISGGAARSILARFETLLGPAGISPESILALSPELMRTAGVSPQKAGYLLDLADKVHRGTVALTQAGRLSDEEVIVQLTQVKGIGVWTAQMFLMFSLGREDVFPHADLGIRAALRNLYALKSLPDPETAQRIARPWRPFATVASWYCWRSLEFQSESEPLPSR